MYRKYTTHQVYRLELVFGLLTMLAVSSPDHQLICPFRPQLLDSSMVKHGCDARLS